MKKLFRQLSLWGASYSIIWAKIQILEAKLRVKNIAKGMITMCLSILFWVVGITMFFASLFFHLSELEKYSQAGLLTGLISCGVGAVIVLFGIYFLKARG